jgi:hypothetical protein
MSAYFYRGTYCQPSFQCHTLTAHLKIVSSRRPTAVALTNVSMTESGEHGQNARRALAQTRSSREETVRTRFASCGARRKSLFTMPARVGLTRTPA